MNLSDFNATLKDMYPLPGTRIKQWVVDTHREAAWERETCPRVTVPDHDDNTGAQCRNTHFAVPWTYLAHDCCGECNDWHDRYAGRDDVKAWIAERDARPPIEADRSKLSDEVEPERAAIREHPLLGMLPR